MFKLIVASLLIATVVARRPILDGRIVGGEDADITDFPYQLSLQSSRRHICGASIIGDKWALTAAHCTDGSSAHLLSVVAGVSQLNADGQRLQVVRIHQNPNFSRSTLDSDVSVLELEGSFKFGVGVNPISLADEGSDPQEGSRVVVSGWGTTREGGSLPIQLQSVALTIVKRENCNDAYPGAPITPNMICAGVANNDKDSCQGDSGGPLAGNGKQVGVVSWGYGCARPGYPGVYANVASLRSFIQRESSI